MMDERAKVIARQLLDADLRRRDEQLAIETMQIKAAATFAGTSGGSRVMLQVTTLCKNEMRTRVNLAWDTLQKVLSNLGLDLGSGLAEELQAWIDSYVEAEFQSMSQHLAKTFASGRSGYSVAPLQEEAAALKQEFAARIALFVATLQRRTKDQGNGGQSIINFYGTVGAVQTGSLSTATVSQAISTSDMQAVEQALLRIGSEIEAASDAFSGARSEVLEVLGDLRTELRRDQPNTLRVRHLAMAVATAIQTSAAMQPAYTMLKGALVPLGIVLP